MDLLMIAFGLSMDAFAVSTTNGMCVSRQQTNRFFGKALSWSAMFGLFQGLMPLLGYFLGRAFSEFISSIDHWVAFAERRGQVQRDQRTDHKHILRE